ncbi:MAG TPA: CRISPR-associated endonuclease Cas1 [Sedimentisphaerales bacterium]|nr:CRISPR-associated endonuclease Cas1 [Sedimentisphaerales bacterium]HQI28613.1 CRISPR-associated endonuclease Cas1 [Sedimentisphaerales bacterium]
MIQSADTHDDPHAGGEEPDLLPVRMLTEYAYCPRLFHLMHVEGRWADNAYTVEGRNVHRRADRLDHVLPDPQSAADDVSDGDDDGGKGKKAEPVGEEPPTVTRSVMLGSATLGLTGKLDLVSTADDFAVPVETKRGRVPNNQERSYEPERVQLMAQGLLLRENGYQCDHGVLYFAGSRTRVDVPFTPELQQRTLDLIHRAKDACGATVSPPPLDDSPKCNGCSLAGICLPDETHLLQSDGNGESPSQAAEIRQFFPARDETLPLYVQEQGAMVCKTGKALVVWKQKEKLATVRLADISQLVLCGNISVTAQTIHMLCEENIPIVHLSMGNWFYGITQGLGLKNAYLRAAQFRVAADAGRCLALARQIVSAKIAAQRTFLRRNAAGLPDQALEDLAQQDKNAQACEKIESLLGIEGLAAKVYFAHFSRMIKGDTLPTEWDFAHRNRRPPRDPINALLSFGYAMLAKECTVVLAAEGFDPYWGFYHQPRHGRPSLALDLMEEFRTPIVDSAVITAINTGMIRLGDFEIAKAGCAMKPDGRKAFIRAYEGRLDQLVTHPVFDYRCSWRTILRLQAKLLARWVRGEIDAYPGMETR